MTDINIVIDDLPTNDLDHQEQRNINGGNDRIVYVPGGVSHVYTNVNSYGDWDEVWHTGANSSRLVGHLAPDLILWRY